MKKIILILAAMVFITQLPAQIHKAGVGVKNTNDKTVIHIPLQQEAGNETMPLSYNILTTRVELKYVNDQKKVFTADTLTSAITQQRWSTTFGTPNHCDAVHDLMIDYDNGYYLVGYNKIASGSINGWDIKTNINGSLLYEKKLVCSQVSHSNAVCNDNIGNKYIAGIIFGDSDYWPFLIKFNACGEKQWCTIYKDWGYEWGSATDMLINDEGNIIVLTKFSSDANINEVFLLCYNPDGDLLWTKPYASKNNYPLLYSPYCTKIYQFGEDYILSGRCYYAYPANPISFLLRPFFIGIDSQFNEKWILPFGVGDSIVGRANSAIPLNDSVIMGVGHFYLEQSGYFGRSSAMMFFNHDGEELGFSVIERDSIIPGTLGNTLYQMETINDSLYLATAIFGNSTVFNPWGELVIDTSGRIYKVQAHPNSCGFSSLVKTFDNKYVIASGVFEDEEEMTYTDIHLYKINANLEQDTLYTQTFVYDSLCPYPITSGDIDMSDCYLQVGFEETPTPEEYYASLDAIPIKAYPNPATNIIRFDYKNTARHQNSSSALGMIILHCYNAMGQHIYSEEIISGQQGSKLDVSEWNSGIYIAVITSDGKVAGKVKFVVKDF